ncbi:MAG: hypothetical protein QM691_01520 [Opitutaceae bacterium]
MPTSPTSAGSTTAANTTPASPAGNGTLTPARREIVEVCADAVQQLGLARSVGQIFGVIYASPRPLAFADVVASLEISNGSASQGLRFLRELGAVRTVDDPEGRRELFVPETELRRLLAGVLKRRFREPLEAGVARLKRLEAQLAAEPEAEKEFLQQRVESLRTWHRKALRVLPLLQIALGSAKESRKEKL